MLLLLATYILLLYCTSVFIYSSYRGIFTVGVAVTQGNSLSFANALTDYSYFTARSGTGSTVIAHCLTGLGPSGNDNGVLGGLYYFGDRIPNRSSCSVTIQPIPSSAAGVINIAQCGAFSTAVEGIYMCTMMNSSMMNELVSFGVYFTGRSESLDLYIPSLNHLSSLYTAAPLIDPPSVSTVNINVGDPLTLSCTSRGSPPDTFTWRKDNDPTVLQSTSITVVNYTSTNAVFHANYFIDRVTTSDRGIYTCTITNPIGSDSATIIVIVIGRLSI